MGKSILSRFCEYEVKNLHSPACSRQEDATSSLHIHRTWEAYFSPSLYLVINWIIFSRQPHFLELVEDLEVGQALLQLDRMWIQYTCASLGQQNDLISFHIHNQIKFLTTNPISMKVSRLSLTSRLNSPKPTFTPWGYLLKVAKYLCHKSSLWLALSELSVSVHVDDVHNFL